MEYLERQAPGDTKLLAIGGAGRIVLDHEQSCEVQSAQTAAGAAQSSSETYQDVYNGWKWWHVYCYRCHGQDALGTTLAPNLTDPNVKIHACGIPTQSSRRITRQRNASLGQASRRQADHSALLLRHRQSRKGFTARSAGRSWTERWPLGPASRLAKIQIKDAGRERTPPVAQRESPRTLSACVCVEGRDDPGYRFAQPGANVLAALSGCWFARRRREGN